MNLPKRAHRRGATAVEILIIIAVVGLVLIGGFLLFGKSLLAVAQCQGDAIQNLGAADPCAAKGPVTGGSAAAGNAKPTALNTDPNGPICDRMGRCTSGGNCFAAGTMIPTKAGLVAIETIKAGDQVLAAKTSTFDNGAANLEEAPEAPTAEALRPVERVVVTEGREIVELDIRVEPNVETLRVTPDHAFWVDDRGWVRASDLAIGVRVHAASGRSAEVVARRRDGARATVYNLEVADVHTYFAGASQLLGRYTCERLPATDALRTAARTGELWTPARFEALDRLAACRDLRPDDYALLAEVAREEANAKARYLTMMRANGRLDTDEGRREVEAAVARPWFARAAEAVRAGAEAAAPGAEEARATLPSL